MIRKSRYSNEVKCQEDSIDSDSEEVDTYNDIAWMYYESGVQDMKDIKRGYFGHQ